MRFVKENLGRTSETSEERIAANLYGSKQSVLDSLSNIEGDTAKAAKRE